MKVIRYFLAMILIICLTAGIASTAIADDTLPADETETVSAAYSETSEETTDPEEQGDIDGTSDPEEPAKTDEVEILDTEEPTAETDGPSIEGWSFENGTWYYYSGGKAVTSWHKIKSSWYFFHESGAMATGWQIVDAVWYYLRSSGEMVTGWQKIDGAWYYFNWSGAMLSGQFLEWGGNTYFLHGSGRMAVSWQLLDGDWYYFYGSGVMATGWQTLKNTLYYFDEAGVMAKGWKKLDGKWYYFDGSGAMTTGWQKVGSYWYHMDASGVMETGWKKIGNAWYYMAESGVMTIGWKKLDGKWYYFRSSGEMAKGWQKVGDTWYFLSDSGAMVTGWLKRGTTWYYLNGSGAMVTGWRNINNKWYFFNKNGAMTENAVRIAICGLNPDESIQVDDDIWQAMEDMGALVIKVNSSVDVSQFDGLLVPGGIDIDPSIYGQTDQGSGYTDISFDREQLAIIAKFAEAGKPILGICRGCELLNVYFGGTLIQDISGHNSVYHTVSAAEGSTLRSVCGNSFSVRSYHHQAIDDIGDGFTPTMWAPDQVIEGLEHSYMNILGVMWHPEWSGTAGEKLIDHFIYTMCTR